MKFVSKILIYVLLSQWIFIPYVPAQDAMGRRVSNRGLEDSIKSFGGSQPSGSESDLQNLIPTGAMSSMGGVDQSPLYYNIHVLGEVARPGTYKIMPSDRVTDAFRYAGELLPSGTQKAIQLRRDGATKVLDIYRYKYSGDLSQNPYLMENDVVFVPLKKGEIEIEGPVSRPGRYEMIKPISLAQALKLAGGFVSGRSLQESIRIIRYDSDEKKQIIEVSNSDDTFSQVVLKKGDIVLIPHVLTAQNKFDYTINRIPGDNIFYPTVNDKVNVIGAVVQPGPYSFRPNLNYMDYVGLAGPSNSANMRSIKVLNGEGERIAVKKVKEINPGDTIIVPSKSVTVTNFLMVFNTLTSMFLTTIAVRNNF